jgi:hypothetical protein
MCFSASASLTTSAVLIPTGIYCVRTALDRDRAYRAIACLPLFFGIQQACEGFIWLGIDGENPIQILRFALGFLFFSHFVWPAWIPLSALMLEEHPLKKKVLYALTAIGTLYGSMLYVPLVLNSDWLHLRVVNRSIDYQLKLVSDHIMPSQISVWFYVFLILIPLFMSSLRSLNILGVAIAASETLARFAFNYAFISVWCFFAALLSVYVFSILGDRGKPISEKWS